MPVRTTAERVRADWGEESCCIALHVPGIDPVVRANLGTDFCPFPGVRYGWLGGGLPLTVWPHERAIK